MSDSIGTLQHTLSNGELEIQWPTTAPHLQIQSADSVPGGLWQPQARIRNLSGTNYNATLPLDTNSASGFFRLKQR